MKKIIFSLISLIIIITACSTSNEPNEDTVTLEEKIGQMLMIGFRGFEVSESSPIVQDIKAGRVGGVILFDYDYLQKVFERNIQNPEQVKALNASLKSYAKIPLLVAVDQEGGKVNRLKQKYGFPASVSEQYLGTLNNNDSTDYYYSLASQTLKDANFNVNFAPVVDLNVNPECPVIGKLERSFSADPDIVTALSTIAINSFHQNNIFCSLKHFPGHGSSTSDSHYGVTDVTNTWSSVELTPYQNLINAGLVDIIMTAHIFNSNWDTVPATLSKNVITNMLRNQLHYNGVVISDDMNMAAISEHYGLETVIELSINAGVDILIFANNLAYDEQIAQKAIAIIKQKVEEGKIPLSRINESYQRIMTLKAKMNSI